MQRPAKVTVAGATSDDEVAPYWRLLVRMVQVSVADARQDRNPHLRRQGMEFLWSVAPTIAKKVTGELEDDIRIGR